METQFDIRLLEINRYIIPVLEMIAAHNSGLTKINLAVIEAHVMTFKAMGLIAWDCLVNDDVLQVNYEGKPAIIITEKMFIGELTTNENY